MTINRISGNIGFNVSNLPSNSNVISITQKINDRSAKPAPFNTNLSFPYEGFLNKIQQGVRSLLNRQFDSQTRNPDFNLLSMNGTTPVTPAQGNGYQIIDKWFLGDGGGNNYTITPTAYTNPSFAQTGSNYFLNLKADTLTSPLYLWNQNYSTTGQFNSIGQVNDSTITFSSIIANNNANLPKVRFSLFMNDTGDDVQSGGVYLQPNSINLISTSVKVPDMSDTPYVMPYAQPRFYIEDLDGSPIDLDISYIKSEASNFATGLNLNHVLEQIICNALM